MADLKESIFADDVSRRYEQTVQPTGQSNLPHEMSPFRQTAQKRQFLRPTFQDVAPQQAKEAIAQPQLPPLPRKAQMPPLPRQTNMPPLPQKGEAFVQKAQFPGTTAPIGPKFSLPTHHTTVTPPMVRAVAPRAAAVHPQPQEIVQFSSADTQQSFAPTIPHPNIALPGSSQQPRTKAKRQRKQKKPKKKLTRGRLIRRIVVLCSILTIIALLFSSQANGASGAWTADTLRAIFGPTITAQVESWYLGVSDTTHQLQYKLSGQKVTPPWTIGTSPIVMTTPPPKVVPLSPMPLNPMSIFVTPPLSGEGVWVPQSAALSPYGYVPLDAKAFIRPDPSHPYAIVTLLQFDTRFFRLHMVSGTTEPGGPLGHYGTGVIPASDQKGNALLAAFNGGFKYADGQYGLKTNGIVYVPPQSNAATIAITKSGQIILGAWGVDPRLNSNNSDLVAWRQNASLLINNGAINPLTQDGAAWGGTILNSAYTWRSAIGITAHGTLIYAAGSSLTAFTIGEALKAAGAVMAMQTDINPFWVRAFLYNRNSQESYDISKLNPAMYGTGTEYLYATARDFFYLTRFALPPPPPVVRPRETASQ